MPSPVILALGAGLFTWALTALGATVVFGRKQPGSVWLDGSLGFAGGVMIAASFWSLLEPAVELSSQLGMPRWLPATVGCLLGAASIRLVDLLLPHLHPGLQTPEGIKTDWHRSLLLVLAITLHNIPEGLAIGVAFGAVGSGLPGATLGAALALTLGIALQNVPEGMAVALPIRQEGKSARESFMWGQASALVEPLAAVVGAGLVLWTRPLLPFALAFAAGAMIFVVIEEVMPAAHRRGRSDLASLSFLAGFVVMMALDLALG
jgi:ZIP family zinc transporter